MKRCTSCNTSKLQTDFGPEKRVRDGKKSCCKQCCAIKARGREEYFRNYYIANREARLRWYREKYDKAAWQRKRRTDPRNRLDDAFGMLLHASIKHKKQRRKWSDILGYGRQELIAHLTARFKAGMTLENYGQWHIDHIQPRAAFVYASTDDLAFKECWSLSNLQPLWAKENMSKSDRVCA